MANISPMQVRNCLSGMDYPAEKNELVEHAKSNCDDQEVVEFLSDLQEKDYNSPVDVTREIGGTESE